MTRRYLALLACVLVAAVALSFLGPPKTGGRAGDTRVQGVSPVEELTIAVRDGALEPAVAAVPKGARVRVRIENQGTRSVRIALSGYEDRFTVPALAPGDTWSGTFAADLPGEDFAWLVDGKPAARLAVTGSHLVEGHR